ncbi:hypothetical protein LF1_00530 [Rubripirellula obstinata]|uniref:Uncharacterized protein n=1 Tax=Rubripirellula obstinata TaxID=406547 RepID=A0A5B1CAJ5_9BACT|nr:hypothetical protein LF1_00530 [Rubripirellula obstinata]
MPTNSKLLSGAHSTPPLADRSTIPTLGSASFTCDHSFRSLLWTVLVDPNGCSRRGSPTGRDAGDTRSNPRLDSIPDSEEFYRGSKLVHVATSRRCFLLRRLYSIHCGGVPPMFSARAGHARFAPMFSHCLFSLLRLGPVAGFHRIPCRRITKGCTGVGLAAVS